MRSVHSVRYSLLGIECAPVVRGLAHVDVIVGVHWLLGTHLTTEGFNSSVRQDLRQKVSCEHGAEVNGCALVTYLVDVHVGLSARTSLPHHEREVLVADLAGDYLIWQNLVPSTRVPDQIPAYLVSGLDNSLRNFGVQSVFFVDNSGCFLQNGHGLNKRQGHTLCFTSNIEVLEGADVKINIKIPLLGP
jgi:hypothetical protein